MYSVDEYLKSLEEGESPLSPKTIRGYRSILKSFADFLKVPMDELHLHLTPQNLKDYATSRKDYKPAGTKLNMTVLRRYYWLNEVSLANGRLEEATLKRRKKVNPRTHHDVPLTLKTLQDMMAIGNDHSRAILAFLISTGCRAGECAKLRMSDVDRDVVTIPDEIAKRGQGGEVYLTSEAREYLDKWLAVRDKHIHHSQHANMSLIAVGLSGARPKKDNRLFGVSYNSMQSMFTRLYNRIGGVKVEGKTERNYHTPTGTKRKAPAYARLTLHSCRRYFSTHASETMNRDLVEYLMRHSGYLASSYYRNEKARKEFHRGEHALYINKGREEVEDLRDTVAKQSKELAEQKLIIDQLVKKMREGFDPKPVYKL